MLLKSNYNSQNIFLPVQNSLTYYFYLIIMVKLRDGGKIIIPFAEEGLSSQSFDFSINHVWM